MRFLFTSPGRRVELIELFKKNSPKQSRFFGTDFDQTSPASYFLDKVFNVPYKIDKNYINIIHKICIENKIDLLIPLIDPELYLFAKYRDKFKKENIFVMVSNFSSIKIAYDKWKTFRFLNKYNLSTPSTILLKDYRLDNFLSLPLIAKPRTGSASKGIILINNIKQLENCILYKDYILQKYIEGDEITVDIFGNENGKCYEIVQRKRLKIRCGEVERGVTIKNNRLFELSEKLVSKYKPNGVINVQFIIDNNSKPYIIEINPRFGGGYPLSYHAGANFPLLLLRLIKGEMIEENIGNYDKNVYMLRYDNAIYRKELIHLC